LAAFLKKNGISAGDRVAVLGKNNEHVTTTMYAALKTGAIFVPLNYRLQAPELVYILNNCGASLLVYDDEFGPIIEKIRKEIPVKIT
jgi:acyl-CoA synthetase (AMP-forming)/AMP-acid ligase II